MRYSTEERIDDLRGILAARSHADLQRHLVLHPPAAQERETHMAVGAFRRAHAGGPDGAIDSFVLMTTDPRWKSVAHDLGRDLVATELLDDGDLDAVAEAIIGADRWLHWACPDEWFSDEVSIEISWPIDDDDGDEDDLVDVVDLDGDASEADDDPGPALARRDVHPGTRRWAVERLVRRDVERWEPLLARAGELSAKDGAPILLGLMDAADQLPRPASRRIDRRAAESKDVVARLAALRRIATYDLEAALARGRADANKRVRAWADAPRLPVPSTRDW